MHAGLECLMSRFLELRDTQRLKCLLEAARTCLHMNALVVYAMTVYRVISEKPKARLVWKVWRQSKD